MDVQNLAHDTEFTVISLSEDTPTSAERRGSNRHMSVLQAGKLVTDRFQELCLIRNISSGGMMAEIFAPVREGETVGIEFKAGVVIAGTVRWVKGTRAGIEFSEHIDVQAVLAPHRNRLAPRSPRLDIDGMATIEIGDEEFELPVFDISQGGVKIASHPDLEDGLDVIVNIEGLPLRASYIRWADDEYCGVSFNNVMPLSQIAYWAAQQTPRQQLQDVLGYAGTA